MKTVRGMGRIFQRGSRWWIAYYSPCQGGTARCTTACGRAHEVREPAGDTDADAKKLLKIRQQALAVHRAGLRAFQGPRQEKITVVELLDDLERDYKIRGRKGLPQLRSHLKHVRGYFALDLALAITPARLRDYIVHRQNAGAADATINRELEGLQRAFALAVEAGTIVSAPRVPSLREQNARQGFFERGDFEAVCSHLPDDGLRDFVRWFYWTGMRPGEVRALSWTDFDKETWTIRLHARDAKTGFGRAIALGGELRAIIERRLKARRLDCPLVFHRDGKPIGECRKSWATACAKGGLAITEGEGRQKKIRPLRLLYDLRRTAVRNMCAPGLILPLRCASAGTARAPSSTGTTL